MNWFNLLPLLVLGLCSAAASDKDIFEAARSGDLDRIRQLVASGVDVNTRTPYQATALTFAAEKGHKEIVRYLLERGAKPDVEDRFYHMTPLGWAVSTGKPEIAEMLIPHGKMSHELALIVGAFQGYKGVVKAVLAQGPQQETLIKNLATSLDHRPEIQALIKKAKTRPDDPAIELPEKLASSYAGLYRTESGEEAELIRKDGNLHLRWQDKTFALEAVRERALRVKDDHGKVVEIYGRGDSIEGITLDNAMQRTNYTRADEPGVVSITETPDTPTVAVGKKTYPRKPALNWAGFRGPAASGNGDGQNIPTEWDVKTGKNIRWKTAIPGLGHSSPVVWGERVYLTTAVSGTGNHDLTTGGTGSYAMVKDDSEHTWKTYCLDTRTGKILWEHQAGKAIPETQRHLKATQANATPVTDGKHLVAVFPTAGMFCYDMDGKVLWHKDLGGLDSGWFYDKSYSWGFSSSPVIYDNLVILQVDIQEDPYIAAWDLASGKQVWKTPREEIPTWSTPNIYRGPSGDELITNGTTIRGYHPKTGKELWTLGPNSEVIIPTPLVHDDLIYVTAGYPPARPIYAFKPGGRGDISPAVNVKQFAWRHEHGGSYMPSPIIYEGIYYIGHHRARLVAYDAKTGELVYKKRFSAGGTMTGSPVASDGRLYFTTEEGQVYVIQAGRQYKELALIDMGEVIMTTPAISDGTLYLRTAQHLFALSKAD
ncbi:MAG: PQQ-binding-like beta-propeller repeat protein [Acidobacteriota bacterium]|nr:PQQ-binding-like beta-propeller repeat protein [Acidobacteriota bacterium]